MQTDDDLTQTLTVKENEAPKRLDLFLKGRFEEQSRSYFQKLIDNKKVTVNGKWVKKQTLLSENDRVEVTFELLEELHLEPEAIPLDILYEDPYIIAINKPRGLVVHPAPGNWRGTLVNALLFHCKGLNSLNDPIRPGIVHRLDKDTSGVIVAAKTLKAHQKLVSAFSERETKKTYLAICVGTLKTACIDTYIERDRNHRKKMQATQNEQARHAITYVEVLKKGGELSFVQAKPITGRTHQIRVHLAHAKAPILGDPLYGNASLNKKYKLNGQLLHASELCLPHPISGETICFQAPLPPDMESILGKIT